jgi:choline-sulfatase
MPPQLIDLQSDPEELPDIAADRVEAARVRRFEHQLRNICGPEEIDRRAKSDQAELVKQHGGREKVVG